MPIIDLQRRLAEIGRIRLGRQVESRGGKKRPAALDTFRLTSRDRDRISEAAQLYGGTVTEWDAPNGIRQFEVITNTDKLPVVVPPSAMAFSQFFELWSAGGCQRRCDGVTESIGEQPCLCDPETRQCEIHTRLSVMLRDLSGLGVWRVDTQGWYAAVELQGAVEVIGLAAGRGQMLPATLRLDQRTIKRPEEGTKRFVVPVLDIDVSPAQLLMGTIAVAPKQAALTPVPAAEGKPSSIAEQVAGAESIPSRRRAPAIPATGIGHREAGRDAAQQFIEATKNEDPWKAVDDARDAAETTQDQPRMVTKGQLTKLGTVLSKRGFDRTAEGKAARMDFCREALKLLVADGKMKAQPWTGRKLSSSTELTFDEAHALIDLLESEEKKPAKGDTPAPPVEPVGEPAALTPPGETDELLDYAAAVTEPEADPDQLSLLADQETSDTT
jgi:hypothetical protein